MSNIAVIDEKNLTLQVKEQSLGVLITNAKQLKEMVQEAITKYSVDNYSEDNIDQAKKDKAMLNKFSKELNSQRLKIQREFMAPFDVFKAEVDDIVKLVGEASGKIDSVVKGVEDKAKAKKRAEIEEYYNSTGFTLVPPDRIFNPSWLNKTASMKSVREAIDNAISTINSELASIERLLHDHVLLFRILFSAFFSRIYCKIA